MDDFDQLQTGTLIAGIYKIIELAGRGANSHVYKAEHLLLQTKIAIKVLSLNKALEAKQVERFRLEAKTAGLLDHPAIVRVLSSGFLDGDKRPFLVLEWIEGETLQKRIERQGRLSLAEFKIIFRGLLEGLVCAHKNSVLHRDIKPQNIILSYSDDSLRARLTDFGIARIISAEDGEAKKEELTASHETPGTLPYMSPEQCQKRNLSFKSDIYSLGCVFFESLCGRPPFESESSFELMYQHIYEPAPKLSELAKVPESYSDLVSKCLEKDPEKRWSSASELLQALNALPEPEANGQRATGRKSTNRYLLYLLILFVLLLTRVVVYDFRGRSQGDSSQIRKRDKKDNGNAMSIDDKNSSIVKLFNQFWHALNRNDCCLLEEIEKKMDAKKLDASRNSTIWTCRTEIDYLLWKAEFANLRHDADRTLKLVSAADNEMSHCHSSSKTELEIRKYKKRRLELQAEILKGNFDKAARLSENHLLEYGPEQERLPACRAYNDFLAQIHLEKGDLLQAVQAFKSRVAKYEEQFQISKEDGPVNELVYANLWLAYCYALQHEFEKAKKVLTIAGNHMNGPYYKPIKSASITVSLYRRIAEIKLILKDYQGAIKILNRAEKECIDSDEGNSPEYTLIFLLRSELAIERNDLARALEYLIKAEELAVKTKDRQLHSVILAKTYLLERLGREPHSVKKYKESILELPENEWRGFSEHPQPVYQFLFLADKLAEKGDLEGAKKLRRAACKTRFITESRRKEIEEKMI